MTSKFDPSNNLEIALDRLSALAHAAAVFGRVAAAEGFQQTEETATVLEILVVEQIVKTKGAAQQLIHAHNTSTTDGHAVGAGGQRS